MPAERGFGEDFMSDERLFFNGVDGATGEYLLPSLAPEELVELLDPGTAEPVAPGEKKVIFGIDPRKLEESGWGVVFARDADPAVRQALEPLLAHRRAQAGRCSPQRFREYSGGEGYRHGESASSLLRRLGVGPGPIDSDKAPYYLLLVGGPCEIPYHVQYELDLAFAIGRLSFETAEEYARYAETVVAAETGRIRRPRRVGLLASSHDPATEMSCRGLVAPLAEYLDRTFAGRGWQVDAHLAEAASKDRFGRVLGGDETPALAVTASHGVRFPSGHPRQRAEQGAFLCQEWGGADGREVGEMRLFGGRDVADDARPEGLVSFHFACYGAGCPARDDFAHKRPDEPPQPVAPEPLVAALPRRLLGHPNGGALAVIGHVDRAWGWSYVFGQAYQREVFESTLAELLCGYPVGAAMERFGERHGQLAGMLAAAGQRQKHGETGDPKEHADLLTATHDARNYVVLGDPAVRLAVDGLGEEA